MSRLKDFRVWAHGVVAAFIGGGASAVTASVAATMIAPDSFNLGAQLGNFFKLAVTVFLVNGFMSAMAYLKQSPLPPLPAEHGRKIGRAPGAQATNGKVQVRTLMALAGLVVLVLGAVVVLAGPYDDVTADLSDATYDVARPANSEDRSLGAAAIRQAKAKLRANILVNHLTNGNHNATFWAQVVPRTIFSWTNVTTITNTVLMTDAAPVLTTGAQVYWTNYTPVTTNSLLSLQAIVQAQHLAASNVYTYYALAVNSNVVATRILYGDDVGAPLTFACSTNWPSTNAVTIEVRGWRHTTTSSTRVNYVDGAGVHVLGGVGNSQIIVDELKR